VICDAWRGYELDLIDAGHQQVLADVAQVIQDDGLTQEARHQPHKHASYGGRQWRKVLQRSLLQEDSAGRDKEAKTTTVLLVVLNKRAWHYPCQNY